MPLPSLIPFVLFSYGSIAAETKVDICHVSDGGARSIVSVAASAVPAHLGHGDWLVTLEVADDGIDNDCDGEIDEGVSLEGSIAYTMKTEGEVVCEAWIDLVGSPYTGDCNDCTFAFEIDATLVTPVDEDCMFYMPLALRYEAVPAYKDMRLSFWDTYVGWAGYVRFDVLGVSYTLDLSYYGYDYSFEMSNLLAWEGSYYSRLNTASFSDGQLEWVLVQAIGGYFGNQLHIATASVTVE